MSLLHHDVLVVHQVSSFMSNDFAVCDRSGVQIGHVHTEGSTLGRLAMGSRKLAVVDGDGTLLLRLHDTVGIGRDKFQVSDGFDQPLAEVRKEISFLRTRLKVTLASGEELRLEGKPFAFEMTIHGPGGQVAQVSRQSTGLVGMMTGRDRYVVQFTPQVPIPLKQATLGAIIAVDLIRVKQRNS